MASSGQARRRSIRSRSTMRRPAATIAVLCLGFTGCSITGEATHVTETGATLTGSVHPVDQATDWWFEHGETERYGRETQRRTVPAGGELVPVSERIGGLLPETDYHFRLCSQRPDEDRQCGDDSSFRTVSDELPPGFEEQVAFTNLVNPTAVRFAPDGRVFVAERHGAIKVFDDMDDTTPAMFADLRKEVHAFWDRGLLGLALDPEFPARPFVYVLYTHDAAIGGTAPRWGTAGGAADGCPTPPGATGDGCVVSGRISRLKADGNSMTGPEQVLVEDWCQQYPSHSVGSLAFGPDGSLYASRRRRAPASTRSTTASSARRGTRAATRPGSRATPSRRRPPRAGRCAARTCAPPATPPASSGTVIRVDPETGEGHGRQPGRRRAPTAMSGGSSPRACATRSVSPPGPAPTRSGWAMSAGTTSRRSTGCQSRRTRASTTSAGPASRARAASPATTAADLSAVRGPLLGGAATLAVPILPALRPGSGGRGVRHRQLVHVRRGVRLLRRRPLPGRVRRRAVLRRLLAQLHLGDQARRAARCPAPAQRSTFLDARRQPRRPTGRPRRRAVLRGLPRRHVRRIVYTAGNRPPNAVATADPRPMARCR